MELHIVKMEWQQPKKLGFQEPKMQILPSIIKNIVFVFVGVLLFACTEQKETQKTEIDHPKDATENVWRQDKVTIAGNALGTSFTIKTSEDSLLTNAHEIDSIFSHFNSELSTYIPSSLISRFNDSDTVLDLNKTDYFKECFELSHQIYRITDGAFDPTVYPLVSLWGFFKSIDIIPSDNEIDSVLAFVGMKENTLYTYEYGILKKIDPRLKLVFNAIAKGQSVDVLANFLESKGHQNYYIEVGGEIRVKGMNSQNEAWKIGIDEPVESNTGLGGDEERVLENIIKITDKGIATSGNYRDYYELNGVKYSHTINPVTGKPIRREILSATVVAPTTAMADGFATAFMVMGVENTLALIQNHPEMEIEAYLLYQNGDKIARAYSPGMKKYLVEE
ncbi:MAG: FAD:protein FMN transferase [Brumimicrobium sp.]|nr:FAD:protein FMN transferase [Brumimicrobium sp.]MCO5268276.1 FAD:protein FMN transferase [Brumimicrobium sp.]